MEIKRHNMVHIYLDNSALARIDELSDDDVLSLISSPFVFVISSWVLAESAPPAHESGYIKSLNKRIDFLCNLLRNRKLEMQHTNLKVVIDRDVRGQSTYLRYDEVRRSLKNAQANVPKNIEIQHKVESEKLAWIDFQKQLQTGDLTAEGKFAVDSYKKNKNKNQLMHNIGKDIEKHCYSFARTNNLPFSGVIPQTIWMIHSFPLTLNTLASCGILGDKIHPNDAVDFNHFWCSAYSDYFVARDYRLCVIMEYCPGYKPKFIVWEDFIKERQGFSNGCF